MYAPTTLSEAIDEFLTYQSAQVLLGNHSERTLIAYRQDFAYIRSALGAVHLADLAQRTIDTYYAFMGEYVSARSGKKLSPHTINKRLRSLRRLFNFCKQRGYLSDPPHVQLISADVNIAAKTIPLEDLHKILKHAQTKRLNRQRDTFIVIALMDFGARRSEIANLRIGDVDRAYCLVTIHRKGGRIQTLPVSEKFIQAFDDWMAVRPNCFHDFVLCATNDLTHPPLNPAALGQAFHRMARQATGRTWGPHSVRHCWISEVLNNTEAPPNVVRDIAGHRNFRTTEQYVKPDLTAQRRVINRNLLDLNEDGEDGKDANSPAKLVIFLN